MSSSDPVLDDSALDHRALDRSAPDYVIVGGGTAGPALAARLAEDSDITVLLLEAGGPLTARDSRIPALWPRTLGSEIDWGFATVPQPGLGGRVVGWPRGRVLGGSSALNLGGWIRGNRADYDAWEEYGGAGWNHATMLALYRRAEDSGRGPAPWRGVGGPVRLSEPGPPGPVYAAVERAVEEAGFGGRTDVNGPDQFGSDTQEMTFVDGERHTPADGYLRRARPNLEVRTGARATRVVVSGGRAVGVEVDGRLIRARREVVLAAGAIGSPHLLLLSGIGPAAHLAEHGVPVVADVPGVGANLHDHLRVALDVRAAPGVPGPPAPLPTEENLRLWGTARRGPLRDLAGGGVAFLRTDEEYCAPDVELLIGTGPSPDRPDRTGYMIAPVVLQPQSRGTLRLASADPSAPPLLDPAYLTEPEDLATLVLGLRAALWITEQPALAPYTAERSLPVDGTQRELEDYVRANADTVFHPVGTARIGRDDDPLAVVDARLRVRGVRGLRVADASVIPVITRGHTMAPAVVVGERAADLILSDHHSGSGLTG
ncbi:GMC family oxidoreductase [Actinomadura roseirufa]|uniref:GMC family oxidoreductase n=1 Tax=Actinomadura roseirufa TaxID=2094049 RepID=UPI001040F04E|nr:GMC family oxidoreductase N-terminal domain-containing protein [Actinomadura roseirufa]